MSERQPYIRNSHGYDSVSHLRDEMEQMFQDTTPEPAKTLTPSSVEIYPPTPRATEKQPPSPLAIEFIEELDGEDEVAKYPELTECSAAANVRLMYAVLELQEVIKLWSDFKILDAESTAHGEKLRSSSSSSYLTRCYVGQILTSWHSLKLKHADVSQLRANGNATRRPLRLEQDVGRLIAAVLDWSSKNMPRQDRRAHPHHRGLRRSWPAGEQHEQQPQQHSRQLQQYQQQHQQQHARHHLPYPSKPHPGLHDISNRNTPSPTSSSSSSQRTMPPLDRSLTPRRLTGSPSAPQTPVPITARPTDDQTTPRPAPATVLPACGGRGSREAMHAMQPIYPTQATQTMDSTNETDREKTATPPAEQPRRRLVALELATMIVDSLAALALDARAMRRDIMLVRNDLIESQVRWMERRAGLGERERM